MIIVWVAIALLAAIIASVSISKIDRIQVSSGTTTGTFGTEVSLQLGDDAQRVIALMYSGADPTYTTAEGHCTWMDANCTGWPYPIRLITGPYVSSGPGTNGSGQGMIQDIIPTNLPAKGGSIVKFRSTPTSTCTTAMIHEAHVMYAGVGGISRTTIERLRLMSGIDPIMWADAARYTAGAGITADAENAMTTDPTTGINLPAGVQITAARCYLYKHGAITAGEEIIGYILLKSSIATFLPQNLPVNAMGATLGTPVGTGQFSDYVPFTPLEIGPVDNTDARISPYAVFESAVTTNGGAAMCLVGS